MAQDNFVSIVVPAHNEEKNIQNCILSLLNQDFPKDCYEIIVVDNESRDGTRKILSKFRGITILHEKKKNRAIARNKGIRRAQGSIIAFLDGQLTADKEWLKYLTMAFQDQKVLLAGGVVRSMTTTNFFQRYCDRFLHRQDVYSRCKNPFFATCNMAARKQALEKAGLFDQDYHRCEDLEICTRMVNSHDQIKFEKKAVVYYPYPKSIFYIVKKGLANGTWIGVLTRKTRKDFMVRIINYRELLKHREFLFILTKLTQDMAFRAGYIYGRYIHR